jgi:hypothetical protein
MVWPNNTPPQRDGDAAAGIDVTDEFEGFAQRNDVFSRAFWDKRVMSKHSAKFFASYRMEAAPRRGDGFSHRDFALRNAAWLISDMVSNRDYSQTRHRLWLKLALSPLRRLALRLSKSHGGRRKPGDWWAKGPK